MNDYLTQKMIDMKHEDSARRQRNADHLAALDLPRVSLWSRLTCRLPRLHWPKAPAQTERPRQDNSPTCAPARRILYLE